MGVIKNKDSLFEIRCSVSEETLYIPSSHDDDDNDDDDVDDFNSIDFPHERDINQRQIIKRHPPTIEPFYNSLKNFSSKKKFRRYHNAYQLITLIEDEELQEVTIEDFFCNSKTAFTIIMEDEKALEKWNEFISSSEEHQRELLEKDNMKRSITPQPLINRTLRNLLRKKNLPIGILQFLEQELITFFSAEPTKTYISPELNSFQRLLLHSVSNYYHLASLSFVSKTRNVKLVQVKNPNKKFPSQPLSLVQYIKETYGLQ